MVLSRESEESGPKCRISERRPKLADDPKMYLIQKEHWQHGEQKWQLQGN